MARVANLSLVSSYNGGSTPTWKKLGYSSQEEWLKEMYGISSTTGRDYTSTSPNKTPSISSTVNNNSSSATQNKVQGNYNASSDLFVPQTGNSSAGESILKEPIKLEDAYGSSLQDAVNNSSQKPNPLLPYLPSISGSDNDVPTLEEFPTINQNNNSIGNIFTDIIKPSEDNTAKFPVTQVPTTGTATEETPATGTTSNEFSATYQGNSFLDWYRANYGREFNPAQGFSRPQGMSDVDWAIGNNLYSYYLTGQNLENSYNASVEQIENNYNSSLDALNTSKRNSQQAASITLDKLRKYLPTQIKAQGLGGLGVSESSMLQAYSSYNNDLGEIERNYNTTKSTLDSNRNSTLSDLEQAYMEDKTNLGTSAGEQSQSIFDKYLSDYNAEQDELYALAQNAIEQSGYTTEDEMMSYINQIAPGLSSDKLASLQQYASGVAAQNAEARRETAYNNALNALTNSSISSESELNSFIDQYRDLLSETDIQELIAYGNSVISGNLKATQDENFARAEQYYLDAGWTDAASLEAYFNQFEGKVSEEQWATLQAYLNDVKNSSEEQDRQEALEEQEELEKYYSITTSDVSFNNNGGWWIFGATDYRDGDNFSVKDRSGFIYRIQSGGEVTDTNIINAAASVGNQQVFGYGGQIYYKQNGKIYLVEKRDNSYGDHYDKLYDRIFGSGTATAAYSSGRGGSGGAGSGGGGFRGR